MLIFMFFLFLNFKKRGLCLVGWKMSVGVFDKFLEKLVFEGVNINLLVDFREYWVKYGINWYVILC